MSVVDASVQVALLSTADRHHAAAAAWYRSALRERDALSAPSLLLAEVAAAIRRGTGDDALALRAVARLARGDMVQLAEVDTELAGKAAHLAATQALRGCDALYVALAAELDQPLVTLDRQQAERAAGAAEVRLLDAAEDRGD
jgi:predicted nucleic acid-binding protein